MLATLHLFCFSGRIGKGRQVYFPVHSDHSTDHESPQIDLKAEGVIKILREEIQNLKGISCLFIYGNNSRTPYGTEKHSVTLNTCPGTPNR